MTSRRDRKTQFMDFIEPTMVNEHEISHNKVMAIETLVQKLYSDQTPEFHILPYFEKR